MAHKPSDAYLSLTREEGLTFNGGHPFGNLDVNVLYNVASGTPYTPTNVYDELTLLRSQMSVCPTCRGACQTGGEFHPPGVAGSHGRFVRLGRWRECERCAGLWVEVGAFEKICADREQQSAVLGTAVPAPAQQPASGVGAGQIQYAPCPQCGQLMNRINFARRSGVIVDFCKGHGTWFDRDELREIVRQWHHQALAFIRTKAFGESWADFVVAWERVKRLFKEELG